MLILTGKSAGSRFFLPRIPMSSDGGALPFKLMRRQFPVKLAWAMTINKAQGQSLGRAAIILPEPVFAHGQLYVAGGVDNTSTAMTQPLDKGAYFDGCENSTQMSRLFQ